MSEASIPATEKRPLLGYIIGFGVPIGIGLSPWLGNLHSPVWSVLLDPFPVSLRSILVPLSTVVMGAIAVATQFYSRTRWSRSRLEKIFGRLFLLFLLSTVLLTAVYFLVVVRVPMDEEKRIKSFAVGLNRDADCPCKAEYSDTACVKWLNQQRVDLSQCWSDRKRRLTELCLSLVFLTVTSLLSILVGILLVDNRRALRRR